MAYVALLLALAACAGGGGGGVGGPADAITQEQIDEAALDHVLQVVQRYRPRWLQPARSPTSSGVAPLVGRPGMPQDPGQYIVTDVYPVVMRDGVRLGELSSLASIDPRTVASIRFISATDATTRYGSGLDGGVIEVVSR
jgi:hypothetical protein